MSTLDRHIREHSLPSFKLPSGIRRFSRSELDEWLEAYRDADDYVTSALRKLAAVKAVIDSNSPLGEDVPADLLREALGLDPIGTSR